MGTSLKSRAVAVQILVVEDSPTQAEHLRYLLEEQDYEVRVAANGREALDALTGWTPTLIITDVVMPEMDGYALCRAVKTDPRLKDIPVVIVTSLSGIHDVAKSLESGADIFIRKPYDPKMLLARVEYILLNLELRKDRDSEGATQLYLEGRKHTITSGRGQIIDLLISTYEEAVKMNEELQAQQQEIARSNQVMSGLYGIAGELNRVSTQAEVCERALQNAMELPKFRAGWIFLADGEGGFRLAASCNLPPSLQVPEALTQADCECWRLFHSDRDPGASVLRCERLAGCAGAACDQHASTALCLDRHCIGILNVLGARGETFGEEDLRMLDAIGNQVAVALERARLYQDLESLVEQRTAALRAEVAERTRAEARVASLNRIYAVLSGINSTIVRVHDRGELFRDACRIAVEHGGFGLAWIGLVDPKTRVVTPVACQGSDQWCDPVDVSGRSSIDDPTLREAMRGRLVVCRNLESECGGPFQREAQAHGFHALVALPLLVNGQPVAILTLYAADPSVFDDAEMRLLEELAGDISFALQYLEKEEQVNYLAYYDALTGLPNRTLLMDRLRQGIGAAQRHRRRMAVICLDLDRFKLINDGLGHPAGDRVLECVGRLLGQCVRDGDTVGRLSADEFVLICSELGGEEDVSLVVKRVHEAIAAPIEVDGEGLRVTASMGISIYPNDASDPGELLTCAHLAMDQAKEMGRNNHQFFTPDLGARVSERLQVESRLTQALDRGEFEVYYQPQVNAVSGVIDGMEALIRWRHPEHGLVPPQQFIPVAEDTQLIVEIGEWVMREACRQNKAWQDAGLGDFAVSVNLSVAQFREESLLASVRRALQDSGLAAHSLELEITESLVMGNVEAFIDFLHEIKSEGMMVAVDDFGTGYSSFSYLKRLPVDRLKVDYSFVRDIVSDRDSAAICRAIVAIAHNLRLSVVAEGVETEAQAAYLAQNYCDSLQGYYMSRPAPADEITALLRRSQPLLKPMSELAARRTLLILDDEEEVRKGLQQLLRTEGYRILVAREPEEGLDFLADTEVGVVLAAQHLAQGKAGAQFLRHVKEEHPRVTRMLLAGADDWDAANRSLHKGAAYKVLRKPWDNEAVRAGIRDAFWQYELSRGVAPNEHRTASRSWDNRLGGAPG